MYQLKNNAKTSLSNNITAIATSLVVSDASKFPNGGNFLITIWDNNAYSDPGDDSNMEILKVTAVSGSVFTIQRAQEGTSAKAHFSGDMIAMLITAGIVEEVQNAVPNHESTYDHSELHTQNTDRIIKFDIGDLDQSQTDDSSVNHTYCGLGNACAQTFTAGKSGELSFVKVNLKSSSNSERPNQPLFVELRTVDGSGNPTVAVLATSEDLDGSLLNLFGGSYEEFRINFLSPYTISSGTKYALVFKSDSTNIDYNFTGIGSNGYVNGDEFFSEDDGVTFPYKYSTDITFKTYILNIAELINDGEIEENLSVKKYKTIDGRDISVDGTKLDTVEENAASLATIKADSDIADAIAKKHSAPFIIVESFTSAAINAAIDSLALGGDGGEIYLPEGEYDITETIVIDYDNITLRGGGRSTILKSNTYANWGNGTGGHIIDLNSKTGTIIRDLKLDGNSANTGGAFDLINGTSADNTIIENIFGDYSDNRGIFLDDSDYCIIKDCEMSNCDADGIMVLVSSESPKILYNSCHDNGATGITTTGYRSAVIGNTTESNSSYGIWMTASVCYGNNSLGNLYGIAIGGLTLVIIIGNYIYDNTRTGLLIVNGTTNASVQGNMLYRNGNATTYPDMQISGTSYSSFIGNICQGYSARAGTGMNFTNCDYNSIVGNTSDIHSTVGIALDSDCGNNILANNNLEGESVAKISDSGTTNLIIQPNGGDLDLYTPSQKTLELQTVVYNDINFNGLSLTLGGTAPDLVTLFGSGSVKGYAFDGIALTEEAHGGGEILHGYKEGEDINVHFHWMPTDANSGDVKWFLEYSWQNIDGTFSTPTTVNVVDSTDSTAWKHHVKGVTITGTGKKIGSQLVFRVYRDPTDGEDTYEHDAVLLGVGIHYPKNTIGSRQEYIK